MKIRNQEDFWAGVMFIGFGIGAIVIARDYPFGSTLRMGPGYFPTFIGGGLVVLGGVISALALKVPGPDIGAWPWRAMVMMSAGFALFAWGIDTIGFIPSLAGLILIGALATPHFKWKEVAIEIVVLLFGSWAVFVYGLGLPFPLWWGS